MHRAPAGLSRETRISMIARMVGGAPPPVNETSSSSTTGLGLLTAPFSEANRRHGLTCSLRLIDDVSTDLTGSPAVYADDVSTSTAAGGGAVWQLVLKATLAWRRRTLWIQTNLTRF